MDLLGRKSKALLEQERAQTDAIIAAYNDVVHTERRQMSELFAQLRSREALASDLLRETVDLKAQVADLQTQLENTYPKRSGAKPIHVGDEESELMWQLNQGLISTSDYENLLKDLEFQNSEIELDPDYRPRPDLTY